jgi:hypothetical protein
MAFRVGYREAADPHQGWGAPARAIRAVAVALRLDEGTVRRNISRHRQAREAGRRWHKFITETDELERRVVGAPLDVIDKLDGVDLRWVMKILRNHGNKLGCPRWFIDAVRNDDWGFLSQMADG